jgi:hypothetical protein
MASLLLAAVAASAQDSPSSRIPTVSRLVQLFSRLEAEWMDAARRGDGPTLDRLVADDFEVRPAEAPGTPTPRAEWLATTRSAAVPAISQMAVRALGDVAVVSFRAVGGPGSTAFMVDLWVQRGGSWQIAARYQSTPLR